MFKSPTAHQHVTDVISWSREATAVLETELQFYKTIKEELLKHHEGKFVLIVGAEKLGVFDHDEDAYTAGLTQRGNVPMLIRKIQPEQPVVSIPALTFGLLSAHL